MSSPKKGTLYVLYKGDEVTGVFSSIEEISKLINRPHRAVMQWQTPSWHKRVDSMDKNRRSKTYLIERVPPEDML